MKKGILFILLFSILLTGCGTKMKDSETGVSGETDIFNSEEEDITTEVTHTLKWGIPNYIFEVNEDAVQKINQILGQMGKDYDIEIILLAPEQYIEDITAFEADNGSLDIVNAGYTDEAKGVNTSYQLIQSGYFIPLTDYLQTNTELNNHFADKLLRAMYVNQEIYTLPNEAFSPSYYVYYFNTDYFTEDELSNFDGNIEFFSERLEELSGAEGFCKFINELGYVQYMDLMGYLYTDAVLLDYDNERVSNPFNNDTFCQYLNTLSYFYAQGYMNQEYSVNGSTIGDTTKEVLDNGSFAVYAASYDNYYEGELGELDSDQYIKFIFPGTVNMITGGTTGVASGSAYQEDACDFLSLAYTNEEIANLLIWGIEGTDYQLIDGIPYGMDGTPAYSFVKKMCFGISQTPLQSTDTVAGSGTTTERKEYYDTYTTLPSIAGFQFDTGAVTEQMLSFHKMINKDVKEIIESKNVENTIINLNMTLEESGYDEYVQQLSLQLSTWLEDVR